jgi:hypothetical protein
VTRERRRRRLILLVAPSFLGLAAVLWAIGAGFSPHRLWPVAGFLMVWAASGSYIMFSTPALRRRMVQQRRTSVPRGVHLRKPLWIRLDQVMTMVGMIAVLGTIVAALGFPQVAIGISLGLGAMLCFSATAPLAGIGGLTFEESGLRIHLRSANCLVPWASIKVVDPIGPDHFQMVNIGIDGVDRVCDSVSPDTPRNRRRVEMILGRGEILFEVWPAGIEGQTLARAIRDSIDGHLERAN